MRCKFMRGRRVGKSFSVSQSIRHFNFIGTTMAARLLALGLRTVNNSGKRVIPLGACGAHNASPVGNREVVGYGYNGIPNYADRPDFPMPAVRYRETTPDVQVLREKEKGDWKKLSIEEKKALYRSAFCQTFAEMKAPSGEWKSSVGIALIFASLAVWVYMGMKLFVYNPLPDTFSEEKQKAQLKRMIDLEVNPVEGIASKWDYEKGDWKK